jgi:hypothetical protein
VWHASDCAFNALSDRDSAADIVSQQLAWLSLMQITRLTNALVVDWCFLGLVGAVEALRLAGDSL